MIIAIDGPSGAGKGAVTRFLAKKYHLKKLETGLLYRALAKDVIDQKLHPEVHLEALLTLAHLITIQSSEQEGLHTEEIGNVASILASFTEIRHILNQLQKNFVSQNPHPYQGIILEGRDIGTVICPKAEIKIFLTADPGVRILRRKNQLKEAQISSDHTAKIMIERDERDQNRLTAPLSRAENAYIIDSTDLTLDEVCTAAASYVEKILSGSSSK